MRQRDLYQPLIAESDVEIKSKLKLEESKHKVKPYLVQSGREAQLLLADASKKVSAVFVNPRVSAPSGIEVIRFAHQYRPATPVFLLYDEVHPYTDTELKRLGIQKAVKKPITFDQIMALITPAAAYFSGDQALSISKGFQDPLDKEIAIEDAQFLGIRAKEFLAGSVSFFDLYVRLDSGKYIKLLQAGDSFSQDRLTSYLEKGVQHFYLRKEAQEHYLAYCDQISQALLSSKKISVESKVGKVLNQGEETLKFFKNRGINDIDLQYALNFVDNVSKLVDQIAPGAQPLVQGFLKDLHSFEHSVAVTMIASLFTQPLKMKSGDPIETIGISACFHDLGLHLIQVQSNSDLSHEDERLMTEPEKQLYYNHPVIGADALKGLRSVKPIVVQAVSQHHERRTKTGFPFKIGAGSISMVAEIVGLSDELARITAQMNKKEKDFNFHREVETRIITCFSYPVIQAFRQIFFFQE